MRREELLALLRRLFEECGRCEEMGECGYLLWFGGECIALDPLLDEELAELIESKCEPLLPQL